MNTCNDVTVTGGEDVTYVGQRLVRIICGTLLDSRFADVVTINAQGGLGTRLVLCDAYKDAQGELTYVPITLSELPRIGQDGNVVG